MPEKRTIPAQSENFSEWYIQVVLNSGLAEYAPVRGCMIIKPYGYALWQNIQTELDRRIRETGHLNVYFPLLIPVSFFAREAQHIEGFAKECAVVTHYRLHWDAHQQQIAPDPDAQLTEPYVIRPTSETIIWHTFRKWIQSWRDLPIKINQWANVMRWEMRPRLFLRTSEFLWQEGHTAHATRQEAEQEARQMHQMYLEFFREYLAIEPYTGWKSPRERFAGAEQTYTLEGIMRDGKALQMGTSHFLGQNFARAFDVQFTTQEGTREYVWATSWGVSTRLIGALVMAHGDDHGLRLPPRLAPIQVVIIPIWGKDEPAVEDACQQIARMLQQAGIRTHIDLDREHRPGWKFHEYELRGVPVRIVIGPKDIQQRAVEVARRDTGEKQTLPWNDQLPTAIHDLLHTIHNTLLNQYKAFQQQITVEATSFQQMAQALQDGKVVCVPWAGSDHHEEQLQEQHNVTIRCLWTDDYEEPCIVTGQKTRVRALIAPAY